MQRWDEIQQRYERWLATLDAGDAKAFRQCLRRRGIVALVNALKARDIRVAKFGMKQGGRAPKWRRLWDSSR